jgi:hypothetical protein
MKLLQIIIESSSCTVLAREAAEKRAAELRALARGDTHTGLAGRYNVEGHDDSASMGPVWTLYSGQTQSFTMESDEFTEIYD